MKGGVVEALDEAKRQGKARFVGYTGHKNPSIHLRMLQLADERGFHFDTAQMPLNCFDATYRSFERQVLPEALRCGMGALGMKSLGGSGEAVMKGAVTIEEALRYAMSLPVARVISGIDSLQVLHQNLAIARLSAALRRRNGCASHALRAARRRRSFGTLQIHQEVRRRRRAQAARLSAAERTAVLTNGRTATEHNQQGCS